jgi:hypothetical protein
VNAPIVSFGTRSACGMVVGWLWDGKAVSRHSCGCLAVVDVERGHDGAIREVLTLLGHTDVGTTERSGGHQRAQRL